MEQNIQQQLSRLVKDPNLEKLNLSLKSPNFFNILKISSTEIRHSNFLVWLMSPTENHNLNYLFLRLFLREVFSSNIISWAHEFLPDSLNYNSIIIHREYHGIDIILEHDDFVIAIENKINSTEHSNQLSRYFNTVNRHFPNHKKAFVYLTVNGEEPINEQDLSSYVRIDYAQIKFIIKMILSVYEESLSPRIKLYIEDYLLVLNRTIMKEDDSVDLAHLLYKNHKAAFDFVFENKPDEISYLKEIIEKAIVNNGYILETCNKYYARFLPPSLVNIIPKTGTGWKGSESFLFELAYTHKSMSLKFVISPGNEQNRSLLSNALLNLPKAKDARGAVWLTHISLPFKSNFNRYLHNNDEEIGNIIGFHLNEHKELIKLAEKEIIAISKDLIYS